MKGKLQIVYYTWLNHEPPTALAELNKRGYACILQEVDPRAKERLNTRLGGSATAAFAIVDLGEASVENAESIVRACPHLSGKTVVVGAAPVAQNTAGISFATRETLVETIATLK